MRKVHYAEEKEVMNDHFTKYFIREPGVYVLGGDDGPQGTFYFPRPGVAHRFTAADGPDALFHDHPWAFTSKILYGGYVEHLLLPSGRIVNAKRMPGDSIYNLAGTVHRIAHLLKPVCWTHIESEAPERSPSFYELRGTEIWRRPHDDPHNWSKLQ